MTTAHLAFAEVDAAFGASRPADSSIDLSSVTHADSSLIALLLHAHRTLGRGGQTLKIVNAPASLERLLAAYGIETLLQGALS